MPESVAAKTPPLGDVLAQVTKATNRSNSGQRPPGCSPVGCPGEIESVHERNFYLRRRGRRRKAAMPSWKARAGVRPRGCRPASWPGRLRLAWRRISSMFRPAFNCAMPAEGRHLQPCRAAHLCEEAPGECARMSRRRLRHTASSARGASSRGCVMFVAPRRGTKVTATCLNEFFAAPPICAPSSAKTPRKRERQCEADRAASRPDRPRRLPCWAVRVPRRCDERVLGAGPLRFQGHVGKLVEDPGSGGGARWKRAPPSAGFAAVGAPPRTASPAATRQCAPTTALTTPESSAPAEVCQVAQSTSALVFAIQREG